MARAWYEMRQPKNAAGDAKAALTSAEIFIYGEIGAWDCSTMQFAADLKALGPVSEIVARINSPGGVIFDGIAIHNLLKSHPAKVKVKIDGWAGSIATVVAMAGDEIEMPSNSFMFVHDPSWGTWGTAEELRETAAILDQFKKPIVEAYVKKTGLDAAKVEELMAAETWMDAATAKELGFCDVVTDAVEATALGKHDASRFSKAPTALLSVSRPAPSAAAPAVPAAPTNVATDGGSMSDKHKPAAEGDKPTAASPQPGKTEADIRAQLAAEAEAKANGSTQKPGESPESMAERLRAEAAEITDLCEIAGCPKNAASYIRKGLSPAAVRNELLKRDAAAYDRTAVEPVDTGKDTEKSAADVAASWDEIAARANAAAGFVKKK